jgi:hypothetical protein
MWDSVSTFWTEKSVNINIGCVSEGNPCGIQSVCAGQRNL